MRFSIAIVAMPWLVLSLAAMAEISPQEAKQIYDQMCAGCHGFQGDGGEGHRGGFSPHVGTLANKKYMSEVPDEYLAMIIKKGGAAMGKIATMPAWEHKFTDEQVDALVKHIRSFAPAEH
jgi:mono/diheme cytochrome c family protein